MGTSVSVALTENTKCPSREQAAGKRGALHIEQRSFISTHADVMG